MRLNVSGVLFVLLFTLLLAQAPIGSNAAVAYKDDVPSNQMWGSLDGNPIMEATNLTAATTQGGGTGRTLCEMHTQPTPVRGYMQQYDVTVWERSDGNIIASGYKTLTPIAQQVQRPITTKLGIAYDGWNQNNFERTSFLYPLGWAYPAEVEEWYPQQPGSPPMVDEAFWILPNSAKQKTWTWGLAENANQTLHYSFSVKVEFNRNYARTIWFMFGTNGPENGDDSRGGFQCTLPDVPEDVVCEIEWTDSQGLYNSRVRVVQQPDVNEFAVYLENSANDSPTDVLTKEVGLRMGLNDVLQPTQLVTTTWPLTATYQFSSPENGVPYARSYNARPEEVQRFVGWGAPAVLYSMHATYLVSFHPESTGHREVLPWNGVEYGPACSIPNPYAMPDPTPSPTTTPSPNPDPTSSPTTTPSPMPSPNPDPSRTPSPTPGPCVPTGAGFGDCANHHLALPLITQ